MTLVVSIILNVFVVVVVVVTVVVFNPAGCHRCYTPRGWSFQWPW